MAVKHPTDEQRYNAIMALAEFMGGDESRAAFANDFERGALASQAGESEGGYPAPTQAPTPTFC